MARRVVYLVSFIHVQISKYLIGLEGGKGPRGECFVDQDFKISLTTNIQTTLIRLKLIGLKGPRVGQVLLLLASLLLLSKKIPSEVEEAPRYALMTLFKLFTLFALFTFFTLLIVDTVNIVYTIRTA